MAAKKKPDAEPQEPRATLVSVFGPFGSRVLVEMSRDAANNLFGIDGIDLPSRVIAAVEHDIAAIARRAPELAESGLAATSLALAYELDHPGNAATAKSNCAKALNDTMAKLEALAPATATTDALDELASKRAKRLSA